MDAWVWIFGSVVWVFSKELPKCFIYLFILIIIIF